jgi:NTE family protein
MKSFALALGGGGARGLAHVSVLEAIDEMGVKPAAIAGTSIGALVGAAYAAGMRAKDIRRHVIAVAHDPGEIWRSRAPARSAICSQAPSARQRSSTRKNSARSSCRQRCPRISPRFRSHSS